MINPLGPQVWSPPGSALQACRRFRPLQQRHQQGLHGGLTFGRPWGQQGGAKGVLFGETLLPEAIGHVDVLAELALFREHSLHEWTVGAVGFEPPQQQLGVGAQGSQWIAQLMHEGAQLLVLLAEFLAKLQAFQVTPQGVADGGGTAPHPLVQGQRPAPLRIQVRAQGSQDQTGILEGVPAPTLVRQAQVRVCVGRGKRSFIG